MAFTADDVDRVSGGDVVTASGDKIGSISQIYLDDETGAPSFVAANTGLLGMTQSLVPLRDATVRDGDIVVGYDQETVHNAPRLEDDEGSLSPGQEEQLYSYYGVSNDTTTHTAWAPAEELSPPTE